MPPLTIPHPVYFFVNSADRWPTRTSRLSGQARPNGSSEPKPSLRTTVGYCAALATLCVGESPTVSASLQQRWLRGRLLGGRCDFARGQCCATLYAATRTGRTFSDTRWTNAAAARACACEHSQTSTLRQAVLAYPCVRARTRPPPPPHMQALIADNYRMLHARERYSSSSGGQRVVWRCVHTTLWQQPLKT